MRREQAAGNVGYVSRMIRYEPSGVRATVTIDEQERRNPLIRKNRSAEVLVELVIDLVAGERPEYPLDDEAV